MKLDKETIALLDVKQLAEIIGGQAIFPGGGTSAKCPAGTTTCDPGTKSCSCGSGTTQCQF